MPVIFRMSIQNRNIQKRLRGALAKVKANAAQIIDLLIENAVNRRWVENKNDKHKKQRVRGDGFDTIHILVFR